jgi:DNA-binding Lrp family transcriptional regulator
MELTEDELSLIHALQIRPRASWADLGSALGVTPAVLARRWHHLTSAGAAWVTAYPLLTGEAHYAFVEVGCGSADLARLRLELVTWPEVMSVEEASRDYNLVLTVGTPTLEDLSGLLLDRIASLEGVTGVRSHLAGRLHAEGSGWRMGAIDQFVATAVAGIGTPDTAPAPATPPGPPPGAPGAPGGARAGGPPAAEIARAVDRPLSTVRRQLGRLLRSDVLRIRCDVAQGLTPYTLCVNWWCQVPTGVVPGAVNRLRAHPRVRQVASIPGPANLLFSTWVRDLGEALRVQEFVEEELAPARVLESAVILRTVKRMGWQLGPQGRATGEVVPFSLRSATGGGGE